MIVRRFSPVSSGLFSRRMPNTRSASRKIVSTSVPESVKYWDCGPEQGADVYHPLHSMRCKAALNRSVGRSVLNLKATPLSLTTKVI